MRLANIAVLFLLALIAPLNASDGKHKLRLLTSIIIPLQSPDLTEADRLENLAAASFSKHDYKKAAELLTNSLSLREKALGPNHTEVATTLHNLANVYEKAGKHEQSIPLYLRAISILKSAPTQPDSGFPELVKDYFCAKSNYPEDQNKPDVETQKLIRQSTCALVGFDEDCDFGGCSMTALFNLSFHPIREARR